MNTRDSEPGGNIPQPPPQPDILSEVTNILTDSGSHRPTSGSAPQGRPPFVAKAINALSDEHLDSDAGASPVVALGQPSRWMEPRPTDNQISAILGTASRGFQAITERGDANQFDVELVARSRSGEVSPHIGVVLLTQSASVHLISSSDLSDTPASKEARAAQREGVTNPGPILSAVLVQLTLKLHWSSGSEETKEMKETFFIQAPPRGIPFESPHPGEDREKARPDEQGRNSSATPPEHTPATTDPPTLPQLVSGQCRSVGTNSPIQLNDGVDRGAEQAMKGAPSERNERKRVMVPEEHENRLKDSTNAEPNSATGYAVNVMQYLKALPDASDSRGKMGRSSNSAPSLESRTTPPSTQNRPRDVIRVRSIDDGNSTVSSRTNSWAQHLSLLGDSQALAIVTSSNTLNAPYTEENGRESQPQPGLFSPESQHFFEQPVATEMSLFQHHPQSSSSTGCHSPSPGGDTKQRVSSDFQERSSTPSTRTSSEAYGVSIQPVPLEINHPLAPENRQGEGLHVQPDPLDDLHPEDEPQGPLRAPMRRGLPLEDGPPPPRLRAESPENRSSFWCCC